MEFGWEKVKILSKNNPKSKENALELLLLKFQLKIQ